MQYYSIVNDLSMFIIIFFINVPSQSLMTTTASPLNLVIQFIYNGQATLKKSVKIGHNIQYCQSCVVHVMCSRILCPYMIKC